jgi:hypothetical protein
MIVNSFGQYYEQFGVIARNGAQRHDEAISFNLNKQQILCEIASLQQTRLAMTGLRRTL